MKEILSCRYRAENAGSYGALAAYVVAQTDAVVTLFPGQRVIVVSAGDEKVFGQVEAFAANEGLDVQVQAVEPGTAEAAVAEPTSDCVALRAAVEQLQEVAGQTDERLAWMEGELKTAKDLQDYYFERYASYKAQFEALGVLLRENSKDISSKTKERLYGLGCYVSAVD